MLATHAMANLSYMFWRAFTTKKTPYIKGYVLRGIQQHCSSMIKTGFSTSESEQTLTLDHNNSGHIAE